jgi:ABC-type multidrug transport system fused ATPase/permease subunit
MARLLGIKEDFPSDSTYSTLELLSDLGGLIRPYRWRFLLASLLRLTGDVAWLYPPFAFATLITFLTTYHAGVPLSSLWLVLALWIAAIAYRNASQYLAKWIGYRLSEKVAIDASLAALRHLFLLDMAWHERENSGNKVKRIENAGDGLDRLIRIWFNNLIEIVVNFTGIIYIIANFDTTVLWFLLVFLVTYFGISFTMTRRAGLASYLVSKQEEEVSGIMYEAVANVRTVKIIALAESLYALAKERTDELFTRIRRRIFWFQTRGSFLSLWAYGFRFAGIIFIAVGILHGRFEVGFLVLFDGYFSRIWESVDELSTASQDLVVSKFRVARWKRIMEEPVNIAADAGKRAMPEEWKTLEFRNVSFTYGDAPALTDVSFTIRRGERVGIVGLSGAGKSTLFKLLLKEREEFTGDILFDGVRIQDIRSSDYFAHTSAVLQDTEVFDLTLRDNITIANPGQQADDKLLMQAVEISHVSDFIAKLPDGLDTVIGEKGVRLSGGERQRLGIARAVFKAPQLLLLDEATSHLDSESEEKIRDSLHRFFERVTAVVIAHRLSTIKEMDRILVVEGGRVVEEGSFASLQKKKGRFHELWEKQRL